MAAQGVPSWSGVSQIAFNLRRDSLKKRYQTGGNSNTAIVAFSNDGTAPTQAKSVHVFGANADPNSPIHMDQAKMLSDKQYKPAWLYLDDVVSNAVRAYHPGEE